MTRLVTAALITLLFVANLIAPSGAKAQTSRLARQDENAIRAMRKLPDGSWRIQAHMWDDGPERVE
jgi:ketosteroid isomerase-like protein